MRIEWQPKTLRSEIASWPRISRSFVQTEPPILVPVSPKLRHYANERRSHLVARQRRNIYVLEYTKLTKRSDILHRLYKLFLPAFYRGVLVLLQRVTQFHVSFKAGGLKREFLTEPGVARYYLASRKYNHYFYASREKENI